MSDRTHWNKIYSKRSVHEVSWYREHLDVSLDLIAKTEVSRKGAIIDIGGGASTLVDDLLRIGYENVSVLDISATALLRARERLKNTAPRVHWIEGDITKIELQSNYYDLWHDRAVFHFLTEPRDRRAYVELASHSIKDGGFLIVATFAPQGPIKCSGLNVERYGPQELAQQFRDFHLVEARAEEHTTPSGTMQSFTYVLMLKLAQLREHAHS